MVDLTQLGLLHVVLSLLFLFALLQFVAVPLARDKSIKTGDTPSAVRTAGYALIQFFRSVTLTLLLGAAIVYGTLFYADRFGADTLQTAQGTLSLLRQARSSIDGLSPVAGGIFLVAALTFLGWFLARQSVERINDLEDLATEAEIQRVVKMKERGQWEPLEPNFYMIGIKDALDERLKSLDTLDKIAYGQLVDKSGQPVAIKDRDELKQLQNDLTDEIRELRNQLEMADMERRLDIHWQVPELQSKKNSPRHWLRSIFVSPSFSNFLNGWQNTVLALVLLLLVPLPIVLTQPLLQNEIASRIDSFDQRLVAINDQDALDYWPRSDATTATTDKTDAAVLDGLARAYETMLAKTHLIRLGVQAWQTAPLKNLKRQETRRQILSRFASVSPIPLSVPQLPQKTETDLPAQQHLAIQLETKLQNGNGPVSGEGLLFRSDLQKLAASDPLRWKVIKTAFNKNRASLELSAAEPPLQGMMFVGATGVETSSGDSNSISPDIAVTFNNAAAEDARQRAYRINRAAFLRHVETGDPATAIDATATENAAAPIYTRPELAGLKRAAATLPTETEILAALTPLNENYPPRLVSPGLEADAKERIAKLIIERDEKLREAGLPPAQADGAKAVLDGYAEHASLEDRNNALLAANAPQSPKLLIGRDADNVTGETLDFADIDWQTEGEQTTLTMTHLDGTTETLGPIKNGLLRLALAYAADERPVAATLWHWQPLGARHNLLHPAIASTELGCGSLRTLVRLSEHAVPAEEKSAADNNAAETPPAVQRKKWMLVRERPFQLDQHLAFARPQFSAERSALEAVAVRETGDSTGGSDNAKALKEVVATLTDSDDALREQLQQLELFTRLQRLFRTAIKGSLGASFRSGKLVALMQAVTPSTVEALPTPQWTFEPSTFYGTFAKRLQSLQESIKSSKTYASLSTNIDRCLAILARRDAGSSKWLSDRQWETCSFSPSLALPAAEADPPSAEKAAKEAVQLSIIVDYDRRIAEILSLNEPKEDADRKSCK